MKRPSFLPQGAFVVLLLSVAALAVFLEARTGSIEPAGFLGGFFALLLVLFYLARSWERPGGFARPLAVAGLLGATHLLVTSSGRGDSALYSFYFLPILVAARFWGLRGSTLVGAAVTLLYATFFLHATLKEILAELLEETVTFLFIALLTGDLVDRLRAEELRRREAELVEIERARLAETGLLAAQVAHEFRNPLQVIAGGAETIATRGWVTEAGRGLLADLLHEARRMDVLVGDFLAYGRPLVRRLAGVALGPVIDRAASRVPELGIVPSGDAPILCADAEAMERVFFILLRNAREAGARRAEIAFSARRETGSAEAAIVRIRDDGSGIPKELLEEIFRPFRTGRPGGVGLGLAIARRIVEAHGGTIELLPPASGEWRGAGFEIAIPLVASETAA